jgi:hypothetical protein
MAFPTQSKAYLLLSCVIRIVRSNALMKINISARRQFAREGRVWVRNAISGTDLMHFDAATNLQSKAGFRVDFTDSLMNALSDNGSLRRAVASIDPQARPVRVVAFNKSKSTNWGVP